MKKYYQPLFTFKAKSPDNEFLNYAQENLTFFRATWLNNLLPTCSANAALWSGQTIAEIINHLHSLQKKGFRVDSLIDNYQEIYFSLTGKEFQIGKSLSEQGTPPFPHPPLTINP